MDDWKKLVCKNPYESIIYRDNFEKRIFRQLKALIFITFSNSAKIVPKI